MTLRSGVALTPSFGLAELRRDGFESVFLSVGVSKGRDLQVPGVELDGVVKAVDYLLNVNRGYRMNLGRRVVVIGGGFVAFDAARTALRLGREEETHELAGETDARMKEAFDSARAALRGGATEVTIVSLESFAEMPVLQTTQGHEEFEEARREGVAFLPRRGPKRFLGDRRGASSRSSCGASCPSSTRTAASAPATTTRTFSPSTPTRASSRSASARTSRS